MKQTFNTIADLANFIAFHPENYKFDVLDLSQFDFNSGLYDFAEQIFRYGSIVKNCYIENCPEFVRLLTPFGTLQTYGVRQIKNFSGIALNFIDRWGDLDTGAKGQFFLTNAHYLENWIKKAKSAETEIVESLL